MLSEGKLRKIGRTFVYKDLQDFASLLTTFEKNH